MVAITKEKGKKEKKSSFVMRRENRQAFKYDED